MTEEDREKAREALQFLLDLEKRKGIAEGCDPDYSGGSIGGDLRYIAGHWGITLKE